jgi:hypothetical protein
MSALGRKHLDHPIHAAWRNQPATTTEMTGLSAGFAPALLASAAADPLLARQSIGGWRLGRNCGILPPQRQLSFEFRDPLIALDYFAPQFFDFAA